jgi:dihydroorotase
LRILLRKGRVWGTGAKAAAVIDVAVEGNRVAAIGKSLRLEADLVMDCGGLDVLPGLIDIHAHIREPGAPEKESFESAARAAANGGVTTLVMMPNTEPAIDRPEWVKFVRLRSAQVGGVDVLPAGALTEGRKGENLAPYALMLEAGARVFTDDGTNIQNGGLARKALEAVSGLGGLVLVHPEDTSLSAGGFVHQGAWAEERGLPGMPASAEAVTVAREILLADEVGARVHLTHISTAQSVRVIRRLAGKRQVTSDATFHHLYFSERDLSVPDRMWKVNPPLRSEPDRLALREALRRGFVQCIGTDHAPHGQVSRECPWEERPFGFSSLDLAFPLLNSVMADREVAFARRMEWMTKRPARILGLNMRGEIRRNGRADLIVVDRGNTFKVSEDHMLSRGRNCPYLGMNLRGAVLWTICGGKIVKEEGKVLVSHG